VEALAPERIIDLRRPYYSEEVLQGTRIRNGHAIRAFNLQLASQIANLASDATHFPVVIGGDCSILLGALAGSLKGGPLSLVHIDGHSDFRHPGNYDFATNPGAAAGMDLALATGRGEDLLTQWPQVSTPLVPDDQVVQIGEREGNSPDYEWPDIRNTSITRIDVFTAREMGPLQIIHKVRSILNRKPDWRFWLHLNIDVLDGHVFPAVDSPGQPGIEQGDLVTIVNALAQNDRYAGMTLTIFDPDLDRDGTYARHLVALVKQMLRT
jgi:arginase